MTKWGIEPNVHYAVRNICQESLNYSPFEVIGSLKLLPENFIGGNETVSFVDFVDKLKTHQLSQELIIATEEKRKEN